MPDFLKSIFRRVTADDIRIRQIAEADAMALEYQASSEDLQALSEHHAYLAEMYRDRCKRLVAGDTAMKFPDLRPGQIMDFGDMGGHQPVGNLQPNQPPVKP